jgi:hypothetical protein
MAKMSNHHAIGGTMSQEKQKYQVPQLETISTWLLLTAGGVSIPIGTDSLNDFMETEFGAEEQP